MEETIELLFKAANEYGLFKLAREIGKPGATLMKELCNLPGYKLDLFTTIEIIARAKKRNIILHSIKSQAQNIKI